MPDCEWKSAVLRVAFRAANGNVYPIETTVKVISWCFNMDRSMYLVEFPDNSRGYLIEGKDNFVLSK